MIDRKRLLDDLQRLLKKIEVDLRTRSDEPEIAEVIKAEYESAKSASRTAATYEAWRSDCITQIAAAWVLSTVFVRFLEDNKLIDPPKLSGPSDQLQRARDEYDLYVQKNPAHSVREYLLSVFDELATLPGGSEVFGKHNPVHTQRTWISADAAKELRNFWQELNPHTGKVNHDFTDANWDTRFLGDLYQDMSEAARKKYALLQTPDFVEEFILDRTLEPALDEFGLTPPPILNTSGDEIASGGFRMIDPACGSGHFLLGAFPRILERWQKKEPAALVTDLVQRTMDSIQGVDINPFAIAIARFRLLLAALAASGVRRLADAPAFTMNLACGDSLYHGKGEYQRMLDDEWQDESHYFRTEDADNLRRILREGTFHAVVANPPYITVKDRAANGAYRRLYTSCHMKYSLAVPFMERIFRLALVGNNGRDAGFSGQITANSFMKREFGKKLIEEYFPSIDLTHVIDSGGAYIPGHGIPTVIIFGRTRTAAATTVRTAMGIQGEPKTPTVPSEGKVWLEIASNIDTNSFHGSFVTVTNADRTTFHRHPWSLGGGGAAELKTALDDCGERFLGDISGSIGFASFAGLDDAFVMEKKALYRKGVPHTMVRKCVEGESVRDWVISPANAALVPYDESNELLDFDADSTWGRVLQPLRTSLANVMSFGGKTRQECGDDWWAWYRWVAEKYVDPFSVVFANVASQNEFVPDRGGHVFNGTVLLIKYVADCDDHGRLHSHGCMVSSSGAFWMKQIFHKKAGGGIGRGLTPEAYEQRHQFDGTKLKKFPIPTGSTADATSNLERHSIQFKAHRPGESLVRWTGDKESMSACVRNAVDKSKLQLDLLIRLQEDLDWECYRLYGLLEEDLTYPGESLGIQLGERAFEIVLARKMARGEVQTTWFERHGSQPITELPSHWPDDYKQLVQRRIDVIESNAQIALIEQPEYKRRWNIESWEKQVHRALKSWLLDRLEGYFDFDGRMNDVQKVTAHASLTSPTVITVAQLADIATKDEQFMEVAEVYRDRSDFDVVKLVDELAAEERVPLLPILRYKSSGLDKRAAWERTWELQRAEAAIEARIGIEGEDALTEEQAKALKTTEIGDIPVPPKYASKDFISTGGVKYWKLRGKLDVPKERWISFPHCEGEDQTLPIAWAGYDHLQQVQAISAYFAEVQEKGGSDDPRLVPLLGCIQQLIPWLKQWHNDIHPEFGYRLGDYFEGFVKDEARTFGMTVEEIEGWEPPKKKRKK